MKRQNSEQKIDDFKHNSIIRPGMHYGHNKKKNNRPAFNPKLVPFRSNYDRFGKIASNKNLSQASLSSEGIQFSSDA